MNNLLTKAQRWLNEMGIQTLETTTGLKVHRDQMCNLCDLDTEAAMAQILKEIRAEFKNNKYYWAGKDDNYGWLETM